MCARSMVPTPLRVGDSYIGRKEETINVSSIIIQTDTWCDGQMGVCAEHVCDLLLHMCPAESITPLFLRCVIPGLSGWLPMAKCCWELADVGTRIQAVRSSQSSELWGRQQCPKAAPCSPWQPFVGLQLTWSLGCLKSLCFTYQMTIRMKLIVGKKGAELSGQLFFVWFSVECTQCGLQCCTEVNSMHNILWDAGQSCCQLGCCLQADGAASGTACHVKLCCPHHMCTCPQH